MSDVPMHPQPPMGGEGFHDPNANDPAALGPLGEDGGDEASWLLDDGPDESADEALHHEVQALPDAFTSSAESAPAWAEDEAASDDLFTEGEEDPFGASYVEPETATSSFSRALVPGVAALLLSFSGIAAWAFLKKPVDTGGNGEMAAADPERARQGGDEENVQMARPIGAPAQPVPGGRVSVQKDGSFRAVGSSTGKSPRDLPGTATSVAGPAVTPQPNANTNTNGRATSDEVARTDMAVPSPVIDGSSFGETTPRGGQVPAGPDEMPTFTAFGDAVARPSEAGGEVVADGDDLVEVDEADLAQLEVSDEFMNSFILGIEPLGDADDWGMEDEPQTRRPHVAGDLAALAYDPFARIDYSLDSPALVEATPEPAPVAYGEFATPSKDDLVAMGPSIDLPFGFFDDTTASLDLDASSDVTAVVDLTPLPVPTVSFDELEAFAVADREATEFDGDGSSETPADLQADEVVESTAREEEPVALALDSEPAEEPDGDPRPDDDFFLGTTTLAQAEEFERQLGASPEPVPVEETAAEAVTVATLDVDAAHARLDALFGPPDAPLIEPASEPASEPAGEPEVEPGAEPGFERVDAFAAETTPESSRESSIDIGSDSDPLMSDVFPSPDSATAGAETSVTATPDSVEVAGAQGGTGLVGSVEVVDAPDVDELSEVDQPDGQFDELPEPFDLAALEPKIAEPTMGPELAQEPDLALAQETDLVPDPETDLEPELGADDSTESTTLEVADYTDGVDDVDSVAALEEPAMSAEVEVRTGLSKPDVGRSQRSVLLRPDDGSVWPNKSVPKSKIDGPVMILTPHVGNVRVVFEGGEAIAGRLHAVGKNKIVVDTSLGRITLDALRADRVDRLGKSTRGLSTPTSASSDTRGLDRVRVAAAGGTFYGHLVSQKGSQVTLILDGGYRITLESNDVQPAGRQRTSSRIQRSEPGRGE